MSGTAFIVEDGVCKLKDRSAFAGSVATADALIRTMVKEAGCSVPVAVKMLTKIPAKLLQVNKGELASGKDADVVIWEADPLTTIGAGAWMTVVDGKVVYQK